MPTVVLLDVSASICESALLDKTPRYHLRLNCLAIFCQPIVDVAPCLVPCPHVQSPYLPLIESCLLPRISRSPPFSNAVRPADPSDVSTTRQDIAQRGEFTILSWMQRRVVAACSIVVHDDERSWPLTTSASRCLAPAAVDGNVAGE